MLDPTKAQSKAEASHRLAEIAKTPRARELFKQLAEDYEKLARGELKAELVEQLEASPSLVPVAPLVAEPTPVLEVMHVPETPVVAETTLVPEISAAPEAPVAADAPLAPEAPPAPPILATESDQFLAVLKAFREEAARD